MEWKREQKDADSVPDIQRQVACHFIAREACFGKDHAKQGAQKPKIKNSLTMVQGSSAKRAAAEAQAAGKEDNDVLR